MSKPVFSGTVGDYSLISDDKGVQYIIVPHNYGHIGVAKIIRTGDKADDEANGRLMQEALNMFDLLAEVVHGLDDKGKLTLWEQSVKHGASQIIERINRKP